MTLRARVRDALRAGGVGPDDRMAVGVSGGLDSTVLLRTLAALGQPLVAVHVDHGLRPDGGSDGDFVSDLAAELGVEHEAIAVEVAPGNVQAEARRARYRALADAARRHLCPFLATAHTATDQAETVLSHLARGAGLRGLSGMPATRPLAPDVTLIRPLLAVSRAEVRALADARSWSWREDPSNAGRSYRRNRLRADVLPWLRDEWGDGVDLRIAASADAARASLQLVRDRLESLAPAPGRLSVSGLVALAPSTRRLVLAEALATCAPEAVRSSDLVQRVAGLVQAAVGARVEGGGLRVWRERSVLRIETGSPADAGGTLAVTPLDAVPRSFSSDPLVEVVDADRVTGDVEVRGWEAGDRLRPVGMNGSTLVSDLLRERGVPRADRPGVPVVVVDGHVAWVVGHRLGARVAVTPETRRTVEWTWHRTEDTG